ncbi:MAG: DMT family transporter [Hyphomicrobiaceae bacterium]
MRSLFGTLRIVRRRTRALPRPLKAALFMVLAMGLFVSMGVFIRLAAAEMHTLQVVFFRNFFALILLSPLIFRSGIGLLQTKNMHLYWLRSFLNIAGMAAGFTALTLIPLTEATALGFTAPLFTTLGAILLLGEVIRTRRMLAIAVGFCGVLIIVGPNLGGLSLGASLALTNAFLLAATALIVKRLTETDQVETIILWMVLLSTPMALVPALFVWTWPDAMTLFWLVSLAAAGSLGHYCWTSACSLAEMTQIQPLEFIKLPLTAAAGFLLFAELPGAAVWIGGAIIFLSTAYITRREARLARRSSMSSN